MKRSRWLPCRLPGVQTIAALAMAGCATASLVVAGTGVAAGSTGAPAGSIAALARPAPGTPVPLRRGRARAAVRPTIGERTATEARDTFAVPGGPAVFASNPRTKTLYVMTFGATIALVSTTHCNQLDRSGCRVVGDVPGKAGFQFVIVDPATDTVYALYGGTTGAARRVDVINGATCNAGNTSNCHPVATVTTGKFPIGESLDSTVHTLYVSNNYDNTVSLIDTANCNAVRTSGCGQTPPVVAVGKGPNLSALDHATHTLYVPDNGPGGSGGNTGHGGTTVSLIDTVTCNAARRDGCRSPAPTATVGNTPFGVTVAAGTVYAWNSGEGTVSLINAATCNAVDRASCHQAKPTVTTGASDGPGGSNPRTHTVYAVDTDDDTVSVLDSAACSAQHPAGCPALAPTLATGQQPDMVLADPATGTLYVANTIDNTVSVFNGAACDATHSSGCVRLPPAVPLGGAPGMADVDTATHTVYVANQLTGTLQLVNAAACNADHPGGCQHIAASVRVGKPGMLGSDAIGVAVNQATDTVYVVNAGEGGNSVVRVINGAACNAVHTSGCRRAPATIHVGKIPIAVAVDDATDTVYVTNAGGNTISVINGATCNGTDHSGCGQMPATLAANGVAFGLTVNEATDTLYAVAANDKLAVFNAATCNGIEHSGCGQTPATIKVGSFPEGVAVDPATDTVYVANNVDGGDASASVSVINGATCNGTDHSGCGHVAATVTVPRGAFGLAVDQPADKIIVASFSDSSVSLINGKTCNAANTTGCIRLPAKKPAGSGPFWVAVYGPAGTAYVSVNNRNELAVICTGH
jgi:DNA-binding beta-propeller fold protein YncE